MKKRSILLAAVSFGLLASAFMVPHGAGAQAPNAGDAARGKVAFVKNGCYECHGVQGQGNLSAGPSVAPHPIDYKNFVAYIRAPRGEMPPYSEKILADATAADIHAYLAAIPAGKGAEDIALLDVSLGNAGARPAVSASLAHGRQLFAANCQKCHVSAPIGPALTNVKARLDLEKTIAFIKNPAPPMTKLYPSSLSDVDVADVAAYVQSL